MTEIRTLGWTVLDNATGLVMPVTANPNNISPTGRRANARTINLLTGEVWAVETKRTTGSVSLFFTAPDADAIEKFIYGPAEGNHISFIIKPHDPRFYTILCQNMVPHEDFDYKINMSDEMEIPYTGMVSFLSGGS